MNDRPGSEERPTERSPFGEPTARRSRAVRRLIYGGVLLAALATTYLATRDSSHVASGHGTPAPSAAGSATAVALSGDRAERIGVTFAVATVGELRREVRTVGQVTYDETRVNAVSTKVDGWVEQLFVNSTGQRVRRGNPLLTLYSPMLITAQEELLLAHRLRRDVAAGTADVVQGADDLVESARRRLLYWDVPAHEIARVERRGEARRALTLVSPASGFVVDKTVLEGQRVEAGEALYRVADLSVVWVEGEVFEQDLPAMRVGLPVSAELEAFPGERWLGRISFMYPTLDPETRTARVRVELANADFRLKPGMYATLIVEGRGAPSALSVPRSAVLVTGERHLVFVKRTDGKLEPRVVVTGLSTNDRVEVREGLTAGDTVVASATFLVDAESNLGSALGGMGNMPGMDMPAPSGGAKPE